MKIQSWMIKSWPRLGWYLSPQQELVNTFKHLGTNCRDHTTPEGRLQGETVWMGEILGQPAGLAWEWTEHRPGVMLLADPNSIVCNLRFLDAQRHPLSPWAALVAMNQIVHSLPWQAAVSEWLLNANCLPKANEPAKPSRASSSASSGASSGASPLNTWLNAGRPVLYPQDMERAAA